MKKTINTNQLTPGTLIQIKGRLKYSRLLSRIDGTELQKDINRRQAKGQMYYLTKPYTQATICDAQIIYKNPSAKTEADIFAEESLYLSKSQGYSGYCYNAHNTSPNSLPWIGTRAADGSVDQIIPDGELAPDQIVTLIMKVYKTKQNNGISLEGVIVESPDVQYYGKNITKELEANGIIFRPAPVQPKVETENEEEVNVNTQGPAPVAPPVNNQDAYSSVPQYNGQPQAQPYQGQTQGQPQQQYQYQPPNQPQQVQPQYQQQQQQQYQQQPAPYDYEQDTAPFSPNDPNGQGGIRYQPKNY